MAAPDAIVQTTARQHELSGTEQHMETIAAVATIASRSKSAESAGPLTAPRCGAGATLSPSVDVRCGAAETAAIIEMLDELNAAREAVQAWDGVTQDHCQRARQKYARLLADLFQRHPQEVLAGLRSPRAHTRIWVALSILEAPSAQAIPALKEALAVERQALDRKALEAALEACQRAASGGATPA